MLVEIQKWGNSGAVPLPSTVMKQLNVHLGDRLDLQVEAGKILLSPPSPNTALQTWSRPSLRRTAMARLTSASRSATRHGDGCAGQTAQLAGVLACATRVIISISTSRESQPPVCALSTIEPLSLADGRFQ